MNKAKFTQPEICIYKFNSETIRTDISDIIQGRYAAGAIAEYVIGNSSGGSQQITTVKNILDFN